jgi:hypothetical protein
VFKGDGVYVVGELTQRDDGTGKSHTRVNAYLVSYTRRGADYAAAAGMTRTNYAPQQPAASQPGAGEAAPW